MISHHITSFVVHCVKSLYSFDVPLTSHWYPINTHAISRYHHSFTTVYPKCRNVHGILVFPMEFVALRRDVRDVLVPFLRTGYRISGLSELTVETPEACDFGISYPKLAGWFISWKIPSRNGWWNRGSPISGNHRCNMYINICIIYTYVGHVIVIMHMYIYMWLYMTYVNAANRYVCNTSCYCV